MAFGNFMPYFAGGVGFVDATFQAETSGGEQARISIGKFAPVVGAGAEWKVTRNISFKFDVLHYMVNFKAQTWGLGGGVDYNPGFTFNNDIQLKSLTVGKIGMNYHW